MEEEITLDSIFAKEAADLDTLQIEHLNEHKSQLTQEQKEKFASVLADEETNPAKDGDSDENKDDETST